VGIKMIRVEIMEYGVKGIIIKGANTLVKYTHLKSVVVWL
jgi:hypothetical protein